MRYVPFDALDQATSESVDAASMVLFVLPIRESLQSDAWYRWTYILVDVLTDENGLRQGLAQLASAAEHERYK